MQLDIKVCTNCLRPNKKNKVKCYACGCEEFDDRRMTSDCDSIEAYLEEPLVKEEI